MYNKKLLLSILKSAAEKKEPKLSAKDLEDSNSFMKKGGSLTANLQGTNRLFKKNSLFKKNPLLKKNPLFKKKNYKSKTYSPNAKLYAEGGEPCPDGMVFNEITKDCITADEHQKFLIDWYENRKMPDPLDQENFQKVQPEILSRINNFPPYILSEDLDKGTAGYYDDEEKIIALNKFLPETIQEGSKVHENNHYLTSGAKTIKNFAGPHGYVVEQNIRKPKEINTGNPEWDKNLKNNYEDLVLPEEIQSRLMTFRKLAGFKPDQVITEKDVEDYFKSTGNKLDPDIQDIKQVTKDTKAVVNLLNGIVSAPVKSKDLQFAENGGITTQEEIDAANTAMMKARLAYANEFGNPAAKRMINLPDNPYQFDNGDTGTHYMASMDNYAVPQIQDENGVLQLGDYGPESNEAIRFDSDEDANYFAEHYKDVSPGFINEKKEGGLHKFVGGGPTDCPEGAEWDDQIQSCICINGMVWEAAENRCVKVQAFPSVPINQYTKYINAWEQMHPVQAEMEQKKYEYLRKAPGLNRALGVTKDNLNEKVLRNIAREVDRERNNYVITQYAKDNGFNPNKHVDLVENIAEKGRFGYDMAQNSQYGSKLAPSLWARSAAGLQELGNAVVKLLPGEQGDVFKYKIRDLSKKEQKEIADSKYGALETAAITNLPGQIIANQVAKYVKPIFGGTGANSRDEEDTPGVLSGQYIPGVGDGLATVLNPFTWTGLTTGLMGLPGAVNALKLFTNAKVIDDVAPLLTKVDDVTSLNKVDDVLSLQTTNNKVSEINWGNWNKEIPKNKTLMQEYTAIEEASKANGTWMKNADGTPFNGTPEQFVQQQSQNFKKAYPEGTTTTYRGDATHTPTLTNKNSVGNSVFTGEENLAQHYTGNTDYYNSNIFSTENKIIPKDQWDSYSEAMKNSTLSKYGDKLKIVDNASDPGLTPAGMHKLYVKNSDNQVIIDAKNADWHSIENPFPENIRIDKQLGERTKDYAKQGDYVNTDQIARVLEEQGIDKAIINNIQDGKLGDIIINNQKPGNYLKSMMGNNGMFDLTNPNIYKAIIPAVGGTGLMLNNPGVLPQQNKYGGALDKFVGGGMPDPGDVTCPEGYEFNPITGRCVLIKGEPGFIKNDVGEWVQDVAGKIVVEDVNDERYKDYLIRKHLSDISKITDFSRRAEVLNSFIKTTNDPTIPAGSWDRWWDDMYYDPEKGYDWTGGGIFDELEDETLKGEYGSRVQLFNNLTEDQLNETAAEQLLNDQGFPTEDQFYLDDYKQNVLANYIPDSYLGRASFTNLGTGAYSNNTGAAADEFRTPINSAVIEDKIDRDRLRKIYPDITDKDINEAFQRAANNYISNDIEPQTTYNIRANLLDNKTRNETIMSNQNDNAFKDFVNSTENTDEMFTRDNRVYYKPESVQDYIATNLEVLPNYLEPVDKYIVKKTLADADPSVELYTNPDAPHYSANYPKNKLGYNKYNWNSGKNVGMGTKWTLPKRKKDSGGFDWEMSKKVEDIKNYMEGYYDEDGNYIPGEREKAEEEGRQINFQGITSLKDRRAQKEYIQEWTQYQIEKEAIKKQNIDLLEKYGLSTEEYLKNYKKQGGSISKYNINTEHDLTDAEVARLKKLGYKLQKL